MQQGMNQTNTTSDRNVLTDKELHYVKDFLSWELLAMKNAVKRQLPVRTRRRRTSSDRRVKSISSILNRYYPIYKVRRNGMTTQLAMPKPPGEPQVKGPEWNERDRINDVLFTEKYLTTGLNTGLNELQNLKLRETLRTVLDETHRLQEAVFDHMFSKGWYKMKVSDQQEISQTYTQFSNYRTQFPAF